MKNDIPYEYLAIIAPEDPVKSDVEKMKTQCKNDYGWMSAVYSRPHFTILKTVQPTHNQKRLMACFDRNIKNISPFQIDLDGFDYFSGSTFTLYAKLKDEKAFCKMTQYIQKFSTPVLKSIKGYPIHYAKKAHLTIAKGISEPEFMKAWKSWKNIGYKSTTKADHILLLGRPLSDIQHKYEIMDKFPLLGTGMLETQLSIF